MAVYFHLDLPLTILSTFKLVFSLIEHITQLHVYKTYRTHLHDLNHSIAIFMKIFRIASNVICRFCIAC